MALIDVNWNPSAKELRVFALLQVVFFAIVSWLIHQRLSATSTAMTVAAVSAGLAVVGVLWPAAMRPVYVVWMALALPIGWVVSHLMMALIFYFLFTPIGGVMRLLGRDPLQRQRDPGAKTYWKPREKRDDMRGYFRQY